MKYFTKSIAPFTVQHEELTSSTSLWVIMYAILFFEVLLVVVYILFIRGFSKE